MPSHFVHLHNHTEYSLLDGAQQIPQLIARAKELEMPAVAMTDHGNMFGAVVFYKEAQKAGIRPIIGCETYVAPMSRFDRGPGQGTKGKPYYHLVLLSENEVGFRNLLRLTTAGYLEGFYYRPRIDKALLREHHEGLIALTACMSGELPVHVLQGDMKGARTALDEMLEIFGEGNVYLELQDQGIEGEQQINEGLVQLSRDTGVKVVATNDCHYLRAEDHSAHDVLICIGTGKKRDEPGRMTYSTEHYFKSEEEMRERFGWIPEALTNTVEVAERCSIKLDMSKHHVPEFPVDPGETIESFFRKKVAEGYAERLPNWERLVAAGQLRHSLEEYEQRLARELETIVQMGFPGYFLIVWDFIDHARQVGIPVGPGRGSAAGSLVAYCLRITDIDPLQYDLLFERFLNPERISMPDIDIDFCFRRRGEVIEYVTQKYGRENVAQIITFGTLAAKAAIKDSARVLDVPFVEADKLAKLVPDGPGVELEKAIASVPKLQEIKDGGGILAETLNVALRLEGLSRHAGIHAAGVVITPRPVVEFAPLYKSNKDEIVTQWAKDEVEAIGLLKMDFLGLKTLTLITDTLDNIRTDGLTPPDLEHMTLDDPKTFELFAKGDTAAVFQFESGGMRDILRRLHPEKFEDLIALNALYRPGPIQGGMIDDFIQRRHGRVKVSYLHPVLEPVLKETYGVIVYQEQVMRIASIMGGYTLGGADLLRRAMGKKKIEEMAKHSAIFVKGATDQGIAEKDAREIFDLMEKFAGYGFNKCVVGETSIVSAETGERTTVGDLFRDRRPFTIHALGADERLHPRPVTDVVWNGRKPVFELRTAQGHQIVATANHPFRTLSGWTNLEDLAVGQRIAAPRALPVTGGERWPEHEVIAAAGLLAEGNTCHPSCLYFFGNDRALVEDFASAANSFPASVARVDERADGRLEVCVSTGTDTRFRKGQLPWNATRSEGSTALAPKTELRSGMFRWAASLGILGKKATEKSVPGAVFRLPTEQVELFLGRLWSGDGFIANATNTVPYYATSSERLARDVQTLLLRIGILSGVHRKEFAYRGGRRTGYTVHLLGAGAIETFLARIAPSCVGRDAQVRRLAEYATSTDRDRSSRDTIPADVRTWVDGERRALGLTWMGLQQRSGVSMKEFVGRGSAAKTGFRRSTIDRLARFFGSARLGQLATSDIFWDRVVSIESRGIQDTYDLTVDVDHNFVADGLIVHNSHSAAYALVAYHTGYLKAHFPVHFMAAVLTSEQSNTDKLVEYIAEAKAMGIPILGPDVHRSSRWFSVEDGAIRFGLEAVKGLGEGAVESILDARRRAGTFSSLDQFCTEVDRKALNRKVLEALVKAGALDQLGGRAALFAAIDGALDRAARAAEDRSSGQASLFGGAEESATPVAVPLPDVPHWSDRERLAGEKESLGFYLSGHPLDAHRDRLAEVTTHSIEGLKNGAVGEVSVGGMVTALKKKRSKAGDWMAIFTLEDTTGTAEVVVFPKTYAACADMLEDERAVVVRGRAESGEGSARLLAEGVIPLEDAATRQVEGVTIRIEGDIAPARLDRLAEILADHRGSTPLFFEVVRPGAFRVVLQADDGRSVRAERALIQSIADVLGPQSARIGKP